MIEFKDNLYPLSNIKNIKIDRKELELTIYFMEGLKLFPMTMKYETSKELEKKVSELSGDKKRTLLG